MYQRLWIAFMLLLMPAAAAARQAPAQPAAPPAPPAQQPDTATRPERRQPKDKDRWGWMQLLRDDVNGAMARATLEKKQRNTLEKDLNALRQAIDNHRSKAKVDQNAVNKALKSIRQEFRSKAFSLEERDNILEDLDHLPIKEKAAPRQPRPRNPMPRVPRRYPRF